MFGHHSSSPPSSFHDLPFLKAATAEKLDKLVREGPPQRKHWLRVQAGFNARYYQAEIRAISSAVTKSFSSELVVVGVVLLAVLASLAAFWASPLALAAAVIAGMFAAWTPSLRIFKGVRLELEQFQQRNWVTTEEAKRKAFSWWLYIRVITSTFTSDPAEKRRLLTEEELGWNLHVSQFGPSGIDYVPPSPNGLTP